MTDSTDLLTERLVLHPITLAEAEAIHAVSRAGSDRWAPDYPFDGDLDAVGAGLAHGQFFQEPAVWAYYQIRRGSDGTAIGGIGFFGPPDGNGHVEIGYGLAASARGNGYAAEALKCLIRWALANGASLVRAETTPENLASQRTLTGSGFTVGADSGEVLRYSVARS